MAELYARPLIFQDVYFKDLGLTLAQGHKSQILTVKITEKFTHRFASFSEMGDVLLNVNES